MSHRHVFTITRGAPFLATLADALLSGRLVGPVETDPLGLAAVTVYLPSRRSVEAFGAVLAARLPGPTLLPRLVALGEADDAGLDAAADGLPAAEAAGVPMSPLERRLILARLVQAWAGSVDRALLTIEAEVPFLVPASPADAVGLAGDLERLMDLLTVEGLAWGEIGGAVEAEFSRYFGLTLDFVRIAAENWPRILAERGLSDPVSRARDLLLAESRRLARARPADPVIVAGTTGASPATARLVAAVAGLPRGAVVLPGLDLDLDDEGWGAIEDGADAPRAARSSTAHGHPQAVLHRLLGPRGLALPRADVAALGEVHPAQAARALLLSHALRPAETTDAWSRMDAAERDRLAAAGLAGLGVVEARDEREEALAAAVALRETLETPGATAALVTPDRGLAARVVAELARWGIVAEDSAGTPLARSPAGRLARLAAEFAADLQGETADGLPHRLVALLAHPLARLGLLRADVVRGAAALELGVLRGPVLPPGFAPLRAALLRERAAAPERQPRAKRRLAAIDWDLAALLVDRLEAAFAGFPAPADAGEAVDLVAAAGRHRAACEALLALPGEEAPDPSLDDLDALFDDLAGAAGPLAGRFADYPAFFTSLAGERTVACPARAPHPRLRVLGLVEARLLTADRVVLGGLDEGVWPVRTLTDAFLNRPMRERVGLDPPERRVGAMAHDFVQGLGCRDAVVTRAAKRDTAPTVPSRLLQRLRAFAGEARWGEAVARGGRLLGLAAALDTAPPQPRPSRPRPRPDPALFPRSLSVTEIETLVRDPYAIFARHVLGLDPLDPVAAPPGAASRGSMIHAILSDFAARHPGALPADAEARLYAIAANAFADIADLHPDLHAEWWPRFERMAGRYLAWEAERRPGLRAIHPEVSGRWPIRVGAETFTLRARADRIELRADGGAAIVDFKTGAPPGNPEVYAGFSPQLTLEAAMLRAGAFRGLPAVTSVDLLYVHASGGRDPFRPLPVKPTQRDPRPVEAIVAEHAERLVRLVARFMAGEAAYTSRPFPGRPPAGRAYDHLARVLEWSLADAEGG